MYDILGPRTFFQTTSGMMFLVVVVYFFLDRKFAAQVAFHTMADDLGDQRDEIEAPSIIGTPLTPAVHSSSSLSHQKNGAGSAIAVTQEVVFNRAPPRSLVRLIGAPGVRVLNWSKQRYAAAKKRRKRSNQQQQQSDEARDDVVDLPVISVTQPPHRTPTTTTSPSAMMNRKRDLLHLDHIITNSTPHLHPSNSPRLLAAAPHTIGSFRRGKLNLVLQNSPSSATATSTDLTAIGSFAASNASDSASKRIGHHNHHQQPLVELLTPLGSPAVVLSLSRSKRSEKRTSKLKRSINVSNHKQVDGRNIGKPGSSGANRNAALNFGRRQLAQTPLTVVVVPTSTSSVTVSGNHEEGSSATVAGGDDDDDMYDSDYCSDEGDGSWASTTNEGSNTEEGGGSDGEGGQDDDHQQRQHSTNIGNHPREPQGGDSVASTSLES
eukprot:GFYU01035350.1.p1 GENE.GFYU01035350.1~~GFYU01035350.1.p1  ORF type:complete len:489 (+),score=-35.83 GFYU01035350.1:160-1467(+)